MKKNFNAFVSACIIAIIAFSGCKEEQELSHTQVTPVENLYAPINGSNLFIGGAGSAVFEWEAAKAEDNGVVLYEVLFDKEGGDFSSPIYSSPSDGKGLQRSLTIDYTILAKVAAAAGIAPSQAGKVKWTVWSSKGINVQQSTVSSVLGIERPDGFTDPQQAYLTGTATEGGADLSKAIPFKSLGNGSYEVYTSLKAGEYKIAGRNTGTPETFFINTESKLRTDGSTTVTGDKKVYRIKINFISATAEISEVISVGLWFAPDNKIWYELPYADNSSWERKNASVVFKQEGWGRDERYKFKMTLKNPAGATVEEWFGSANRDNQRPTATTEASYWYMLPVSNNQWDNSFKFNGNADNKTADIKVTFNSTVYTHSVTVK